MKQIVSFSIIIAVTLTAAAAYGESNSSLIESGNQAYEQGKFEDAATSYRKVLEKSPNSPTANYNLGAALYKSGELDQAMSAFKNASIFSKDRSLAAKSKYNLGNTAYKKSEQLVQTEPEAAVKNLQESLGYYRQALDLDPDMVAASENMELTRIRMKKLMEEIAKQKQTQEGDQQSDNTREKLKELTEKQKQAAEKSNQAEESAEQGQGHQQAEEQKQLRQETQELADKLNQEQKDAEQSQNQEMNQHLEEAIKNQKNAEEDLKQDKFEQARKSQQEAAENLEKALDAAAKNDEKKQAESGQQKQGSKENQDNTADTTDNKNSAAQESGEQDAKPPENQTAQDILMQEQQNAIKRRMLNTYTISPVEKDW